MEQGRQRGREERRGEDGRLRALSGLQDGAGAGDVANSRGTHSVMKCVAMSMPNCSGVSHAVRFAIRYTCATSAWSPW
jgi:hypothetical protein